MREAEAWSLTGEAGITSMGWIGDAAAPHGMEMLLCIDTPFSEAFNVLGCMAEVHITFGRVPDIISGQ